MIKVHTFTAPSAWASYLINGGDPSQYDLHHRDVEAADAWVGSIGFGQPVSCEDAGFLSMHDAWKFCPYKADCQTYTFYEDTKEHVA